MTSSGGVFMIRAKVLMFSVLAIISCSASAAAESAADILAKVDQAEYSAKDSTAVVRMELEDRDGTKSVRKMTMYQKGTSNRLIKFLEPADVRGMAFLDTGDDKMYLYLPAMHKIRRIAGHVKNDTFAGTDFSFDDLSSTRFADRLQPTKLEEKDGKYVLHLIPKPDSDSQYGELVMTIRKNDFLFEKIDFFHKDGSKWKEMIRRDFRPVGKYTQSHYVEMVDLKKQHRTRNLVERVECDTGLTDRFFSKRQLKRR
jgi:outer membrane lipoprotein-sorting protein